MSNAFICPQCGSQLVFSGGVSGISAHCSQCGDRAASRTLWDFGDDRIDLVGRNTQRAAIQSLTAALIPSPSAASPSRRRAPRTQVRLASRGSVLTMIMPVTSDVYGPHEPSVEIPAGWYINFDGSPASGESTAMFGAEDRATADSLHQNSSKPKSPARTSLWRQAALAATCVVCIVVLSRTFSLRGSRDVQVSPTATIFPEMAVNDPGRAVRPRDVESDDSEVGMIEARESGDLTPNRPGPQTECIGRFQVASSHDEGAKKPTVEKASQMEQTSAEAPVATIRPMRPEVTTPSPLIPVVPTPAAGSAPTKNVPGPISPRNKRVVYHFVGQAGQSSFRFNVGDHWEIRWSAEATGARGRPVPFTIGIHEPNGKRVADAAERFGPNSGTSPQDEGGTYYLTVNTVGRWTIDVLEEEPGEVNPDIPKSSLAASHGRNLVTINDVRRVRRLNFHRPYVYHSTQNFLSAVPQGYMVQGVLVPFPHYFISRNSIERVGAGFSMH